MSQPFHFDCPECGSTRVRPSHARNPYSRLLTLFRGYVAARCEDCGCRFLKRPEGLSVAWARCPKCMRLDLGAWDPEHYRSSTWERVLAALGAHRWRCEACRCNFVSFRPRKERYIKPSERTQPEEMAALGRALVEEHRSALPASRRP